MISLDALDTTGGQHVDFVGANLGYEAGSPAVHVSATYSPLDATSGDFVALYTASSCVVQMPNTRVRCTTSPGVGTGHTWRLRVGEMQVVEAVQTTTTSYAPPTLATVGLAGGARSPTTGGAVFELGHELLVRAHGGRLPGLGALAF